MHVNVLLSKISEKLKQTYFTVSTVASSFAIKLEKMLSKTSFYIFTWRLGQNDIPKALRQGHILIIFLIATVSSIS